jgi:uncharacterized protein (DUF736 family)
MLGIFNVNCQAQYLKERARQVGTAWNKTEEEEEADLLSVSTICVA